MFSQAISPKSSQGASKPASPKNADMQDMIHEASLINEETISDEVISVMQTDRSATVKVSMIKRNNRIIYQNSKVPSRRS